MQYKENVQKNIRGIIISRKKERAFYCKITIDIHEEHRDSQNEALLNIYVKALLAGCIKYSRETLLDAINLLGAGIHIDLNDGFLTVSLTSLDVHQEKLLSITKAILMGPTFKAGELARTKQLLTNELHEEKEEARLQSHEAFVNKLYGQDDRRYNFSRDEIIASLPLVTRKALLELHKRIFSKQWIYTLVTTPSKSRKAVSTLADLRLLFKYGTDLIKTHTPRTLTSRSVVLAPIPSKQNIEISIGGSLPFVIPSVEYYAFVFGLQVLGKWGGFSGRLMSTVREKEGLTYAIYARTETVTKSEQGYWKIMTFFMPDKVIQGITSTLHEINLIKERGITQKEYDRFKTIIKTEEIMLSDSIFKTASSIHAAQIKGFTYEEMLDHKKALLNVKKTDVNKALFKYLDLSTLVIAAAGPVNSKKKELRALSRIVKENK